MQPIVLQHRTRTSTLWKGNFSRLSRIRRRRGDVAGVSMIAAPSELWDSYLSALEAAPLLTKVKCEGS